MKQIRIRNQAEALFPRLVARGEMGGDVEVFTQFLPHLFDQCGLHEIRKALRQLIEISGEGDVLPAAEPVRPRRGQQAAQTVGDGVLIGC